MSIPEGSQEMPYNAFLPVLSPLEGENGSWGHRRHEFGVSYDFLVDQNGALGQNCPVQRRETVNKRNEQHLKNRIPCRMAKDSFHATPSLFWCFSRLMGIQPGGGIHATGFFPLLNQLKEAGTTCGEQLLPIKPEDDGLARGCERLERESDAGNLLQIVWPSTERGIVATVRLESEATDRRYSLARAERGAQGSALPFCSLPPSGIHSEQYSTVR